MPRRDEVLLTSYEGRRKRGKCYLSVGSSTHAVDSQLLAVELSDRIRHHAEIP